MARIKQLLAEGKFVRLFGIGQLFSPKFIEIVGEHGGYDGLWLDAEHAGLSMRDIEIATLAARAYGMDHFVRLPATDYASIMRPLEAGAGGVMVSMVRSPEDAERAVRWAKFWPRGERGLNGGNRDGRFGLTPTKDYVERTNEQIFVGIQIETAGAIERVAEIAAVPDVDLLFVGPADISQVLGVPGQFEHPRCLETIDRIADACRDAGKPWGIVPRGPEYAARMADRGCKMFVLGFDIHAVHGGIRAFKERYKNFYSAPRHRRCPKPGAPVVPSRQMPLDLGEQLGEVETVGACGAGGVEVRAGPVAGLGRKPGVLASGLDAVAVIFMVGQEPREVAQLGGRPGGDRAAAVAIGAEHRAMRPAPRLAARESPPSSAVRSVARRRCSRGSGRCCASRRNCC